MQISSVYVWKNFLFLCFIFLAISWLTQYMLVNDNLYFNTFSAQLDYENILSLIEKSNEWQWVGYTIIIPLYMIKLVLITTCISLGYFFARNSFNFNTFFNVIIFAELIFLLPILIKLIWFLFVQTDYNLNDLTLFYPLSALNLVNTETLPRYWLAPLQTLNLFEAAYWFLLAYGIANATGFSFKRSFGLVMSSYGIGLVLWLVLVMFLTITYS